MKSPLKMSYLLTALVSLGLASTASALEVIVTVENIAPSNGVAITPVWVGFQSGNFDTYNSGLAALPGLERVAEDGNTSVVSSQFLDFDAVDGGYTYVDNSGVPTSALVRTGDLSDQNRVDGTLASPSGPPPIAPGQSVSQQFTIQTDGSNRYFSYLTMVVPTNDFFLANGDPLARDLSSLYDGVGEISFLIGAPGTVNDAGTEEEDFAFSAANGLFPGRGLPAGQGGPDQGPADATSVIQSVMGDPFAGFLNSAGVDLTGLNFNNYNTGGIARITITAIPEPGTVVLLMAGLLALGSTRRS